MDFKAIIAKKDVRIAGLIEEMKTSQSTIKELTEKYLIQENQNWLAWMFVAVGIFSALLFFLEMIGFFDPTKQEQEKLSNLIPVRNHDPRFGSAQFLDRTR